MFGGSYKAGTFDCSINSELCRHRLAVLLQLLESKFEYAKLEDYVIQAILLLIAGLIAQPDRLTHNPAEMVHVGTLA